MSLPPRFRHLPPPKYMPPPDPAYPFNEGAEIARTALLMGVRLQPWQRLVINRATQWRWTTTVRGVRVRQYKYKKVLVSVPRQSGKTMLTGPVQMFRLLLRPRSKALFTAQTGADARDRIIELLADIEGSPMSELIETRRSNGSEGLYVVENGSILQRFSPTASSVHGGHPHLVTMDEIWKFTRELGTALMGAISPSQNTIREEAQIWMVSTKGTAQSEFMNDAIEDGITGDDPALFYAEWSMPDGMDPYDPETWWMFHPALGNICSVDSLREDTGLAYAEWMRGYMNVLTSAENPLIALEDWDHLAQTPAAAPSLNDVAVAYDVATEGAGTAIAAAWYDLDGRPCVRILAQRPGTGWPPAFLATLARRYPGARFYADDGGPTRRMTDALLGRGDFPADRLTTLNMSARGIADGNLLAAVRESATLKHDGSKALRTAVSHAVTTDRNGVTTLSRDKSTAPISSLIAASVALFGADHAPERIEDYLSALAA